jgi:hypothetical protein
MQLSDCTNLSEIVVCLEKGMDLIELGGLDLVLVSYCAFCSVQITLYRCLRVALFGSVTLSQWVKTRFPCICWTARIPRDWMCVQRERYSFCILVDCSLCRQRLCIATADLTTPLELREQ